MASAVLWTPLTARCTLPYTGAARPCYAVTSTPYLALRFLLIESGLPLHQQRDAPASRRCHAGGTLREARQHGSALRGSDDAAMDAPSQRTCVCPCGSWEIQMKRAVAWTSCGLLFTATWSGCYVVCHLYLGRSRRVFPGAFCYFESSPKVLTFSTQLHNLASTDDHASVYATPSCERNIATHCNRARAYLQASNSSRAQHCLGSMQRAIFV